MPGRVMIANPGAVSWMIESAAAFARADLLDRYLTPVAVAEPDLKRFEHPLVPRRVRERMVTELGRRAAPAEVGGRLARTGTSLELANVLLQRTPLPMRFRRGMFRPRMIGFDYAVSRRLHERVGAIIGYQGATAHTFDRARALGVPTVLDYPIAHYEVAQRVIDEEERLTPEYASTMLHYPEWQVRRYEREIRAADRIIMLSHYQQGTFAEAGVDPDRTFIAPLCVDSELFSPPEEEPDAPFRIAFCGLITQRKGISYLVEGFRRAAIPGAELLFIGVAFGDTEVWMNNRGVRHVPPMPRRRLPEILRTCHVIALPSLIEGYGAAALEGMACGLPAIVSDNTFGHDVIEEGVDGWVIPIRDPDAIAERLRALHSDTGMRQRMRAAARRKAEQFPWQRYGDALLAGVKPLL